MRATFDFVGPTLRRSPLASYFVLACLFTWALALPLAWLAATQGDSALLALHYLTAFGPALAAFTVLSAEGGIRGAFGVWRDLLVRSFALKWAAIGAGAPILLLLGAALLQRLFLGYWPDPSSVGELDFLPRLAPLTALLLWLLTFGLGEELGWRGFALVRLLRQGGPIKAALVSGAVWIVWHLPYFLYQPSYRGMGYWGLPVMGLGFLAAAIVLTALQLAARGNVVPSVLFHAGFDAVCGSGLGAGMIAAVMSAAVWMAALVLLVVWRRRPPLTDGIA